MSINNQPNNILNKVQVKAIPDVIEAKLTRHGSQAELCHREYFTYLPDEVRDYLLAVGKRIYELLPKPEGCEFVCKRIEQGLEVKITGPIIIAGALMGECLEFGARNTDEAHIITKSILETGLKTISGKVIRSWDKNAEEIIPLVEFMKKQMQIRGLNSFDELLQQIIK